MMTKVIRECDFCGAEVQGNFPRLIFENDWDWCGKCDPREPLEGAPAGKPMEGAPGSRNAG